jgi:Virulence factor BrkB
VRQVIESSRGLGKGIWAVSVGVITFIIGATAVFGELQAALNRIWDVRSKPDSGVMVPLIVDRLRSFSIALCVGFLLLVSLVISALISGLQSYMNKWLPGIPWFWQSANVVASFFVVAIHFLKFTYDLIHRRLGREEETGHADGNRQDRRDGKRSIKRKRSGQLERVVVPPLGERELEQLPAHLQLVC